jgi:hypothetical protein
MPDQGSNINPSQYPDRQHAPAVAAVYDRRYSPEQPSFSYLALTS